MSTLDSLSGALRSVRAPRGFTQAVLAQTTADRYVLADSAVGEVFVAFNERGISHVARAASAGAFEKQFEGQFGRKAFEAKSTPAGLRRALRGDMQAVRTLKYDISGLSEFAQAVLRKALQIPRGQIRPYGWIAAQIGSPKAVRAVGTALARNPVPLLIPCHRVVRTDGAIGDYALGSANKRRVLESEGVPLAEFERAARSGVRYVGSRSTGVYCYPTCGGARRIMQKYREEFRTPQEARRAGMRACKVCRPAGADAA